MINGTISFNPIWQHMAKVDFFGSFAAITGFTKRLQIPDIASTTFADRLDMINSKSVKGESLIAHKATKGVEFTQGTPFPFSVSPPRLGFSSATVDLIADSSFPPSSSTTFFISSFFHFWALRIFFLIILKFIGSLVVSYTTSDLLSFGVLSIIPLSLFRFSINPIVSAPFFLAINRLPVAGLNGFAFFGCSIFPVTLFALGINPVFTFLVYPEVGKRFDYLTLGTFLCSCGKFYRTRSWVSVSFQKLFIQNTLFALGCFLVFGAFFFVEFRKNLCFQTRRTSFFLHLLTPFKRKTKLLFGNVRQVPTASNDLTKEELYRNNNVLVGKKQKSSYAIGTSNYTIKGVIL